MLKKRKHKTECTFSQTVDLKRKVLETDRLGQLRREEGLNKAFLTC